MIFSRILIIILLFYYFIIIINLVMGTKPGSDFRLLKVSHRFQRSSLNLQITKLCAEHAFAFNALFCLVFLNIG